MISPILRFDAQGTVTCLYTEAIDLRSIGPLEVRRLTDIRFDPTAQQWEVVLVATGEVAHRDVSREACLTWERRNLG